MIKHAYRKRLAEAYIKNSLDEVDVYDKRDNLVVTKDLKVRHKESGLEYTVAKVETDGEDAKIFLRAPEDGRIDPSDSEQSLQEKTKISLDGVDMSNISGEDLTSVEMPLSLDKPEVENEAGDVALVVTKSEFEKDYEVE